MQVDEMAGQEHNLPLPPAHCLGDPAICGIRKRLQDKVIEVDEVECAIRIGPVPHG